MLAAVHQSSTTLTRWQLIAGYYRVNYDSRNWQMLTKQLMDNHTAIPVINRAQIMNDALNLAEAGQLDYETAFNLTRYLDRETEYVPWEAALASFTYISSMMSRTSSYGLLKVRSAESFTECLSSNVLFFAYQYTETLSNDHHTTVQNGRI